MFHPGVIDSFEEGFDLVAEWSHIFATDNSHPKIIAVAGGSASGKTIFAEKLAALRQDSTVSISMDGYYHGRSHRKEHGVHTFDEPEAFNLELFKAHVLKLMRGEDIYVPSYSFKTGDVTEDTRLVSHAPLIVLDGLFVLLSELSPYMHLSVFIDTPREEMLLRRIERDVERTGQTPIEVACMFVEEVYPAYKEHVLPTSERADLIVNNDWRSCGDLSNFQGIEEWVEKLQNM